MRTPFIIALGVVACLSLNSQTQAQYGGPSVPNYGPGYRGNISPYLNLNRGQNTGIDYYLGTRSEFQRRQNASEFREDIDDIDRRDSRRIEGAEDDTDRPVQTGTSVRFGNTLGFYNNRQNFLAPTAGRMGGAGGNSPSPRRGR